MSRFPIRCRELKWRRRNLRLGNAAYWVSADSIAWSAGANISDTFTLHYASAGGLQATDNGITGGMFVTLTPAAPLPPDVQAKFPHLADLPVLKIGAGDLALVPDILRARLPSPR